MPTKPNPPGWDARLADARKQAQARGLAGAVGPEWPKPDDVDSDAALAELTVFIYLSGAKIGAGLMSDGSGVWVRMSVPGDSTDEHAGCIAFTVSDTLDKALRKAVQLIESHSPKVWKPDQFAVTRKE